MKRRNLRSAVWFAAGATPVAMLAVFFLSLSGHLNPILATLDMAVLLVVGIACQLIARLWKDGP
jgi:hypothetical protein